MLACPAEGCTFKTKGDRSLTNHVKECKKATTGLASVGREVGQREADFQRTKRRRILSPERLESVPEVGEPMDVDLEVRPVKRCPKAYVSQPLLPWQDNGQTIASPPPTEAPPPPINAPVPSTSRYGHIRRLPTRFQAADLDLPWHARSAREQKQQAEEEIAEAERCQG